MWHEAVKLGFSCLRLFCVMVYVDLLVCVGFCSVRLDVFSDWLRLMSLK